MGTPVTSVTANPTPPTGMWQTAKNVCKAPISKIKNIFNEKVIKPLQDEAPVFKKTVIDPFQETFPSLFNAARAHVAPAQNLDTELKAIDTTAKNGLQKARELYSVTESALEELDQILDQKVAKCTPPSPPLPPSSSTAEVKTPQEDDRGEDYWKAETPKLINTSSDLWSNFSYLHQACSIYGIQHIETIKLMHLAKTATDGANTKTIRELFQEEYLTKGKNYQKLHPDEVKTGPFSWIKEGLFYLFFYKTDFLKTTISTYIQASIKQAQLSLSNEYSNKRTALIQSSIENINHFFQIDLKICQEYAKNKGNLEEMRMKAHERPFMSDLDKFSKSFIDKVFGSGSKNYHVPLFKKWKTNAVSTWFFGLLESFINKWIIQGTMKSSILPTTFKKALTTGISSTQNDNIPFALSFIKFLTDQLITLKKDLDNGKVSLPPAQLPGTDMFGTAIKNIRKAIKLDPTDTSQEMKEKFDRIEGEGWFNWLRNLPDKIAEPAIEKGVIEAGHHLFEFLNDSLKSGRLTGLGIQLSNQAFSKELKTPEMLNKEYNSAVDEFLKMSDIVLKQIIKTAVHKELKSPEKENLEQVQQEAETALEKRKIVTIHTMKELTSICNQMQGKDEIQADLASVLKCMETLANRSEVKDSDAKTFSPDIDPIQRKVNQDLLWRMLKPQYKTAQEIVDTTCKLQPLQHTYYEKHTTLNSLKKMQTIIDIKRGKKFSQLEPLSVQQTKSLTEIIEKIPNSNKDNKALTETLKQIVAKIQTPTDKMIQGEKKIQAFSTLADLIQNLHKSNYSRSATDLLSNYIDDSFSEEGANGKKLSVEGVVLKDLIDEKRWQELNAFVKSTSNCQKSKEIEHRKMLALSLKEASAELEKQIHLKVEERMQAYVARQKQVAILKEKISHLEKATKTKDPAYKALNDAEIAAVNVLPLVPPIAAAVAVGAAKKMINAVPLVGTVVSEGLSLAIASNAASYIDKKIPTTEMSPPETKSVQATLAKMGATALSANIVSSVPYIGPVLEPIASYVAPILVGYEDVKKKKVDMVPLAAGFGAQIIAKSVIDNVIGPASPYAVGIAAGAAAAALAYQVGKDGRWKQWNSKKVDDVAEEWIGRRIYTEVKSAINHTKDKVLQNGLFQRAVEITDKAHSD